LERLTTLDVGQLVIGDESLRELYGVSTPFHSDDAARRADPLGQEV
jgi:hypothetical protein